VPNNDVMRVLTRDGIEDLHVSDPSERSIIGSHWNAIQHFLNTGEDDRLLDLEGERVLGRPLEIDPDRIEYWARYGELDFEDIYPSTR
jgi:hypothetical protein